MRRQNTNLAHNCILIALAVTDGHVFYSTVPAFAFPSLVNGLGILAIGSLGPRGCRWGGRSRNIDNIEVRTADKSLTGPCICSRLGRVVSIKEACLKLSGRGAHVKVHSSRTVKLGVCDRKLLGVYETLVPEVDVHFIFVTLTYPENADPIRG
jgi:hypothetical protein